MRRVKLFLALACASVLALQLPSARATVLNLDGGVYTINSSETHTGFIVGTFYNTEVSDVSGNNLVFSDGIAVNYGSWEMYNAAGFTTTSFTLGSGTNAGTFATNPWTGNIVIDGPLTLSGSSSTSFMESNGNIVAHSTYIYSGALSISGGTFTAGVLNATGGSFSATGGSIYGFLNINIPLFASGATFYPESGSAPFIEPTEGSAGVVDVGPGGFIVDTHGTNAGVLVPINHDPGTSGTDGGFTKDGAGNFNLTYPINCNGPITFNAGSITFNDGATGTGLSSAMNFNGGNAVFNLSSALALSNSYSFTANTQLQTTGAAINISGDFTTSNSPALTIVTPGTTTPISFSGGVTGSGFSAINVSAGSAFNVSSSALGSAAVNILAGAALTLSNSASVAGTVTLNTSSTANTTLTCAAGGTNSATISGPFALSGAAGTVGYISVGQSTNLTLSGGITGSAGLSISNTGNGNLTISHVSTNTGPTVINSGDVTCTTSTTTTTGGAFGGGTSVTVGAGAILNLNGQYNSLGYNAGLPNLFINSGGILSAGTGTQQNIGNITLTGGTISGGTSSQFVLDQTLHTDASSTLSSVVAGVTIVLRNDNGVNGVGGTIDVAQGTTSNGVDFGIYGNIAGQTATDALTKTGSGYLCLFGTDTYTAGTTVDAGTLEIDSSTAIPSTGTITLNGGTIRAGGATRTMANSVTINGSVTLGRLTFFTGATTLKSNSTIYLDNPDSAANYDSGLTNISGNYGLTVSNGPLHGAGTGYLELNGNNSFTGSLTVNTNVSIGAGATGDGALQGNVIINSGGTLLYKAGNIVKNSSLFTINSGGTLNFNGYSDAIGTISGSGNITNVGSLYLTIGNGATFSGTISGSGVLTLGTASATTFNLNGNDTYTGGTTVNAGTLVAQNLSALGSGGITINGGLLQFANTFHGTLTIPSLAISGGSLDTGKTDLLIKYTGTNPYSSILASIKSAYDAGKWDGAGIYSSSFKAGMSLGIYDNSIHTQSTLDGLPAASTNIFIKFTWLGDANCDGVVNSTDLSAMSSTGTAWQTGDFNYDGKVNADDYSLFELGSAASGGENISMVLPEPTLLLAPGFWLLASSRRGRRKLFPIA